MSKAEIERFAADLVSNEALRAEADKAAAGTSPETTLANATAFAATKGYAFSADDMTGYLKAQASAVGRELTDAELGGIVGGTDIFQNMASMYAALQAASRDAVAARSSIPSTNPAEFQSMMEQADAASAAAKARAGMAMGPGMVSVGAASALSTGIGKTKG